MAVGNWLPIYFMIRIFTSSFQHRRCRYRRRRIFFFSLFVQRRRWSFGFFNNVHPHARARKFTFYFLSVRSSIRRFAIWFFPSMCINLRIVFIIKSLRWLYGHTFAAMCGYIVNFMAKRALMIFLSFAAAPQTLMTRRILGVISATANTVVIFVLAHTFSSRRTSTPAAFSYLNGEAWVNWIGRCRSAIRYASHIHRCHGSQFRITNLFLT